jgi:hypothetical protein
MLPEALQSDWITAAEIRQTCLDFPPYVYRQSSTDGPSKSLRSVLSQLIRFPLVDTTAGQKKLSTVPAP